MRKTWKLLSVGLLAAMSLTLFGCGAGQTPEELTETARAEIPVAEADGIAMTYAGACEKDGKALLWYVSGNEHQAHTYLVMECVIAEDGSYIPEQSFAPMMRGDDIAVYQWRGGSYGFLINNKNCSAIRITDQDGTHTTPVEKEEIPFLYLHTQQPSEYEFLDADGNFIR